jgi:hypothetical protein
MSAHTKGDWVARPDPSAYAGEDWCIGVGDKVDNVAVCSKCDAHLIAAAPDLLAALVAAQALCATQQPGASTDRRSHCASKGAIMSVKTRIVYDGNCTDRRFPRTLTEATGNAYTGGHITEASEPMHPTDKVVVIASVIAAMVLIGLIAWGYLP